MPKKISRSPASQTRHPQLMAHIVAGYPSLKESEQIALTIACSGASFLEVQIPFSDPIADGPTIMMANEAALGQGVTPKKSLELAIRLAKKSRIPVFVMSYYNLLLSYPGGVRSFVERAAKGGIAGLIVPDVPFEEENEAYWRTVHKAGLVPVTFVSPLTSDKRMRDIAKRTKDGFLYCVATTGTTGARSALDSELAAYLRRVRKKFSVPLAVGFGISTPKQVESVGKLADIAIVGSATIDVIRRSSKKRRLAAVGRFIASLRK